MSQQQWVLDKSKASRVGQSSYINGNTQDVFKILSAAWKTNSREDGVDTYYLSLHIMNRERSTAHVDIYYGNSKGERWSGDNLIHAIMLCANTQGLSQVQGQYQQYDFDQSKDVPVTGLVAPELANKNVGMFLADNHYYNQKTGEVKRGGLNLFNVYDADTKQLPFEKSNGAQANPDEFNKVIEAMHKSSAKSLDDANKKAGFSQQPQTQFNNQMGQQQGGTTYQRSSGPSGNTPVSNTSGGFTDNTPVDDDIPF